MHEAANWEPEAVAKRVLVFQYVVPLAQARMGVVPFIRAQPVGKKEKKREKKRKRGEELPYFYANIFRLRVLGGSLQTFTKLPI